MPKGQYARPSLAERFAKKVKVVESGCHEWQSTLHRGGYGKVWVDGVQQPAHRVAYTLYCGQIPEGLWVLHRCDNRRCVNPAHLYAGTPAQNAADRTERCEWWGRMKVPFQAIEDIRSLYATGEYSQQQLANSHGIHQTQVSHYVRQTQRIGR